MTDRAITLFFLSNKVFTIGQPNAACIPERKMISVKIKHAATCILTVLFLSGCHTNASEVSMPIAMETVESVVSEYDTDIIVLEEEASRDGQTAYSLTDGEGQTVAYLSSIGEGHEGTCNLLLMRNAQSESKLYQNNYGNVIPFAVGLFDPALDSSQVYNDFVNAYKSNEETVFDWRNTYNNTTINIKADAESPVEMSITLYNSEKYNPFPREADPEDYAQANPEVRVSEITKDQFHELLGSQNGGNGDSQNHRFYKITVSDHDYHAKFKVDLTLLIKTNLQDSSEKMEYEGILWNHSSDEYAFQDVVGYCQRNGNEMEAVLGIPVVDVMKRNEVQYKERFNYKILLKFSTEDLENIQVSTFE